MNFAADSSDHSLLIFYIPGDLTDSGHEIQSFAVALGARKKGMMIALPTGLLKDEFVAPGRVVEEDALLGPATTFEVDLILDDEFTGTAYFAGFKGEVVVADFANVLNLLRDYDPVTDSTEEIHSFHEVHHAAIPSAADLLAQAMNWVENEGASRVHFYSAREEPTTKAAESCCKVYDQCRPSRTAVGFASSGLFDHGSGSGRRNYEQATGRSDSSCICHSCRRARFFGHLSSYPQDATGISKTSIARTVRAPAKALQLLGPPPRTRASPKTSGPALLQFDEPLDPLKAPPETPEQILSQQSMALNALVSHLIQGGGNLGLDYHAGGTSSSSTKGTIRREKLQ